jgi:hypothetical protein
MYNHDEIYFAKKSPSQQYFLQPITSSSKLCRDQDHHLDHQHRQERHHDFKTIKSLSLVYCMVYLGIITTSWGRAVPSSGQAELTKLDLLGNKLNEVVFLVIKIEDVCHYQRKSCLISTKFRSSLIYKKS